MDVAPNSVKLGPKKATQQRVKLEPLSVRIEDAESDCLTQQKFGCSRSKQLPGKVVV